AAHLAHPEIAIAGHGGHDRPSIETNAVEAATRDAPRQNGLAAGRLRLAVHDAAAGEDLRGARFDVVPLNAAPLGGERSGRHDERGESHDGERGAHDPENTPPSGERDTEHAKK